MEYQDTDTDPYAGYDPSPDPYDAEEPFEFYDEGLDPLGGDELYFADGEPPPEYDYEYDEMYDGPIAAEEEPLYTDDWLPLPPEAIPVESIPFDERPPEYGTELYIGGLQYPDPAEMRDSYCQLYPEACEEGQGLSGREPYNRTELEEEMSRTLKDIDLTGVAIAALLLLVLLFGLHYGGDSAQSGADTPAPERRTRDTPAGGPSDDERKNYDNQLKAIGMKDADKRKKTLDEIMAEPDKQKRQDKVDALARKYYDSELKKAGWKDDEKRKNAVKQILKEPPEKRGDKLEELKKKYSQSTEPPPETTTGQPGGNGEPTNRTGSGRPSSADVETVAKMLKEAGVKDDEKKSLAKQIAKKPKEEWAGEVQRAKDKQKEKEAADASKAAEAAGKEEAKQEEASYVKALKKAGYDHATAKQKAKDIMKEPAKDKRKAKLKEFLDAKKAASGDPPPPGGGKKGPSTSEIKRKLADAGYDANGQTSGVDKVKGKSTPEEQEQELDRLVAAGPKNAGNANGQPRKGQTEEEKQKELNGYVDRLKKAGYDEAKAKNLAAEVMRRPSDKREEKMTKLEKDAPRPSGPDAPTTRTKDKNTGTPEPTRQSDSNDAPAASSKLPSDDEIKQKLKDKGYLEPALQDAKLKQIKGKKGEKAQQKELDRLLAKSPEEIKQLNDQFKAEREKNEPAGRPKKNADGGEDGDSNETPQNDASTGQPSKGPKTAEDLRNALKDLKYSEPAIDNMVKEYEKTDAKSKPGRFQNFVDPKNKERYEKKYGKKAEEQPSDPNAPQPPTETQTTPANKNKLPDEDAMKKKLTEIYTDPAVVDKMMKAIKDAPTDEKKQALWKDLRDRSKARDNFKKYKEAAKTNDSNQNDDTTQDGKGTTPAAGDKDNVAGMSVPDLREHLKKKGYTDKDARDEIIDRIRAKHPDDQKAQEKELKNGYTDRSGSTRDKLNKELGEKRRKDNGAAPQPETETNGGGGAGDKLPDDNELDKKLKAAGWTDPDARKQAIKRIKEGKTPEEQVKRMNNLLKKGAADKDMDKYAREWKKNNPTGGSAIPGGSIANLTPDDKKRIEEQLKDKKYDPDAIKNMMTDLEKTDPKDRDRKLSQWLNDTPEGIAKRSKDRAESQRKKDKNKDTPSNEDGDGEGGRRPSKRPSEPREPGDTGGKGGNGGSSPPYWILALLLIPLLFALFSGDVTMPRGRFPVALPTLPSIGTAWVPRAPWAAREVVEVAPPTGPKINRGLPEITRKKTSKSVSSPRLVARSARKDSSNPSININNVNAQGENIPIDINSGGGGSDVETVVEETVVTEVTEEVVPGMVVEEVVTVDTPVAEAIVEEAVVTEDVVVEESEVEFGGPSDPDRLFWMLLAAVVIAIPLALDSMADWPLRTNIETDYLSIPVHWFVLIAAAILIYLKVDRTFHWTSRYGRPIVHHTRRVVTPMVVGTAQGADGLVWSVDEALFGDSQSMLGIAIVAAAFTLMTLSSPFNSDVNKSPTEGAGQMAGLIVLIGTALLIIYA